MDPQINKTQAFIINGVICGEKMGVKLNLPGEHVDIFNIDIMSCQHTDI